MANVHNAVSDTADELGMTGRVQTSIEQDPQDQHRWLVTFESLPGSLIHSRLHVEILELPNNNVAGCVLEKHNVGRSRMNRIMDTLMDFLEMPPLIPVQEVYQRQRPAAAPPSPQT